MFTKDRHAHEQASDESSKCGAPKRTLVDAHYLQSRKLDQPSESGQIEFIDVSLLFKRRPGAPLVRFLLAGLVEVPMSRYELRIVVDPLGRAKQRLLSEDDVRPGNRYERFHVRPPWPLERKPFNEAFSTRPQDSVPILEDWKWGHDVLQAVECEQSVDGLVSDGQRCVRAHAELDLHIGREPGACPGRQCTFYCSRVEVYPDHAPWMFGRCQQHAQRTVSAAEIEYFLVEHV